MSEVQNAQPSPAPVAAPAAQPETKTQSLDDVYKQFNIEETAQSFQPQSPQPAVTNQPQSPKVPDPFDPNFSTYQQQLAQGLTALQQGVVQLHQQQTQLKTELQRERTEAEIKKAAGFIAEKAGIDADIAEIALEAKARQDPKLLAIWNNRHKNQKALNAALEALSGEFKERFAVRQDPQLVENQRAVKVSQQQMATTTRESDSDKWASMTPQERERERQRILRYG